jgi:hypothetical protein
LRRVKLLTVLSSVLVAAAALGRGPEPLALQLGDHQLQRNRPVTALAALV